MAAATSTTALVAHVDARASALAFKALPSDETLQALADSLVAAGEDEIASVLELVFAMPVSDFTPKALDVLSRSGSLPVIEDVDRFIALIKNPLTTSSVARLFESAPRQSFNLITHASNTFFGENVELCVADTLIKICAKRTRISSFTIDHTKRLLRHIETTEDSVARRGAVEILQNSSHNPVDRNVNKMIAPPLLNLLKLPNAEFYENAVINTLSHKSAVFDLDTQELTFLSNKYLLPRRSDKHSTCAVVCVDMFEKLLTTGEGIKKAITAGIMCKLAHSGIDIKLGHYSFNKQPFLFQQVQEG